MALVRNYFKLTKESKQNYGENTVILMQVGSFFEIYGLCDKDGNIFGSDIVHISKSCDLHIANKKAQVDGNDILMAGFGLYQIDKYINKIQNIGYTALVYTQDIQAANTTRSLSGIYSPGTYFSTDTVAITNNTMCIWIVIERMRNKIHVGIANADIYTGITSIFEFSNEYHHNPSTYDELERFVSIYNPSEVIIISELNKEIINEIITFSGIQSNSIHIISQDDKSKWVESIKNCEKQVYQVEVINKYFTKQKEDDFFTTFYQYGLATQAYCFLLDYIYQHNPNLVNKIKMPIFENCSNRLTLANHTLKQLNIIDDQNYKGKLSSVQKFLNNCVTIMGKRRLMYDLLNPILDVERLNESYDLIEYALCEDKWLDYRNKMQDISDIEKLRRKLVLTKITPRDFYILHSNLCNAELLYKHISKDKTLLSYLHKYVDKNMIKNCKEFIKLIEHNFNLLICKNIDSLNFDKLKDEKNEFTTFVNQNIDDDVDSCMRECLDSKEVLLCIKNYLNEILGKYEKKGKDFIKTHETDKLGVSLQTTIRRGKILESEITKIIQKGREIKELKYKSNYTNEIEIYNLNLEQMEIFQTTRVANKNITICGPQINAIYDNIRSSKEKLIHSLNVFYNKFIADFTEKAERLEAIIEFIIRMDILQCKCYNANKYNYCKPKIVDDNGKSYMDAKGLRHCLIEHLQTQELYVTNNVILGRDIDGILLYGTNAVGKTSLIKSLGITIIMAQAGMYVPCSEFTYYPYSCIFTRILGNDNIFKGLSTFAVEMSELRNILRLSDKNSLILGDELCSGTESDSARSIFIAGLEQLHEMKSTFIFATHFHEIAQYEEIERLNKLQLKHMTVEYNKETNSLIYDRKLKDGPGDSMYGLEVCKALNLSRDFLERAHEIRTKYNVRMKNPLTMEVSRYNNKKVKGTCERCNKNIGSEVHHLQFQQNANNKQYIGSFHKNHNANLINICDRCHDEIHRENKELKKTKTTDGYIFTEV